MHAVATAVAVGTEALIVVEAIKSPHRAGYRVGELSIKVLCIAGRAGLGSPGHCVSLVRVLDLGDFQGAGDATACFTLSLVSSLAFICFARAIAAASGRIKLFDRDALTCASAGLTRGEEINGVTGGAQCTGRGSARHDSQRKNHECDNEGLEHDEWIGGLREGGMYPGDEGCLMD